MARGNYLSYDPDLWINPDAVPFHFVPSTPVLKEDSKIRTETVIKTETSEEILAQDDDEASGFLLKLRKQVISDETIIKFLKSIWTGKAIGQGRNNTAMSYAGVLCKAGIEKSKAKTFIEELIPGFDITEIIDYAYTHNIYGCERRRYIKKRRISKREGVINYWWLLLFLLSRIVDIFGGTWDSGTTIDCFIVILS